MAPLISALPAAPWQTAVPARALPLATIAQSWPFSPEIILGVIIGASAYIAGLRRRREAAGGSQRWRAVSFLVGLGLLYFVLQSPVDMLSDHFFFIHEIQHLVLFQIAPFLLLLAAPQGTLVAGLPRAVKEHALTPLVRMRGVRRIFAFLTHPAIATFLFIVVCWGWSIPPIHDETVLNERMDEFAHLTMLIVGLLYWWRVLDIRPPPAGSSYVARLIMLKIGMMAMALLGGYLTSKEIVLYTAYDRLGLAMSPITDEAIGGAVMWLGGAIIPLVAIVLMFCRWHREPEWSSDPAPPPVGLARAGARAPVLLRDFVPSGEASDG